ncbi:hypothetical protein GCM10007968_28510 [Sporolactobacillus putidus]|uniref:Uncharacterized protein n=1 Tax=Sporolactobacillus putidus TaxID=492735 RepID=A0A917S9L0_9BACL|nr:hypothetical protein GCM10007968_28510 [Sporolactobacillus putidus]
MYGEANVVLVPFEFPCVFLKWSSFEIQSYERTWDNQNRVHRSYLKRIPHHGIDLAIEVSIDSATIYGF